MALAYYISHPQVAIDPAVPVPRWGLSVKGRERLEAVASRPWVASLTRIVSSGETKAIETAERLAAAAGARVEIDETMHENDRSSTGFLPPDEFERVADQFFGAPEVSIRGWERAIDAQRRVVAGVERALAGHPADRPMAFSGHGGVGTLLYCHLAGLPISRRHDQAGGGGNVIAFDLATRRIVHAWRRLEDV